MVKHPPDQHCIADLGDLELIEAEQQGVVIPRGEFLRALDAERRARDKLDRDCRQRMDLNSGPIGCDAVLVDPSCKDP